MSLDVGAGATKRILEAPSEAREDEVDEE